MCSHCHPGAAQVVEFQDGNALAAVAAVETSVVAVVVGIPIADGVDHLDFK